MDASWRAANYVSMGQIYLYDNPLEICPNISQNEHGLKKLFTQFSFSGGISSHVAPSTSGSTHEGGELGYSLSHAFEAVFDNPSPIETPWYFVPADDKKNARLLQAEHADLVVTSLDDVALLDLSTGRPARRLA